MGRKGRANPILSRQNSGFDENRPAASGEFPRAVPSEACDASATRRAGL